MAYQSLAFDIELELSSVNSRVPGVETAPAFDDAGLSFWRSVRQLGRRAELALDGDPELLAFWSADRDHLVSCAERVVRLRLADAVAARYGQMAGDAMSPATSRPAMPGPVPSDIATGGGLFVLDQILYVPFRLSFHVVRDTVSGSAPLPFDLYGFSSLVRGAVAFALPEILGCARGEFIRVRSFTPSPALIGGFHVADQVRHSAPVVVPHQEAVAPADVSAVPAARAAQEPPAPTAPISPTAQVARDWPERFYQLLHPVPIFGFLAACYALFLMLSAEGERGEHPVAEAPPVVVSPSLPPEVSSEPVQDGGETGAAPAADEARGRVREDSPNVRYVPEN